MKIPEVHVLILRDLARVFADEEEAPNVDEKKQNVAVEDKKVEE